MSLNNLSTEQLQCFRPIHDRILIRRLPDAPVSSLIFAPEIAKQNSLRGEVLAVGPGKWCCDHGRMRPVSVIPGQVVYFGQYSDYEDGDLLLITEADIRGVESN